MCFQTYTFLTYATPNLRNQTEKFSKSKLSIGGKFILHNHMILKQVHSSLHSV